MAADWTATPPQSRPIDGDPVDQDPVERLSGEGVPVVAWDGWLAIEAAEQALGVRHGQARIKLPDRADLLAAAGVQDKLRT